MFAEISYVGIMNWMGFLNGICFHSGRTDSDFGHHDYKNQSGLGACRSDTKVKYHWHHGEGPHLPPHKSQGESLIGLLKANKAEVFTTTIGESGNTTYVFEGIITLEKYKRYFTLELTGKEDAFYLIGDGKEVFQEVFFGMELKPQYVDKKIVHCALDTVKKRNQNLFDTLIALCSKNASAEQ